MVKVVVCIVLLCEYGGNIDIKDLLVGICIFFLVYVKGVGFLMGDLYFLQGDGEIGFCGVIEMDGVSYVGFDFIKGGMVKYNIILFIFMFSIVKLYYEQWLIFEGISVENGVNYYFDVIVVYCQVCLKVIDYLIYFGYIGSQVYMLLMVVLVEGCIGGIVDIFNCVCMVVLLIFIFDQDIMFKGMFNDKFYWGCKGQ